MSRRKTCWVVFGFDPNHSFICGLRLVDTEHSSWGKEWRAASPKSKDSTVTFFTSWREAYKWMNRFRWSPVHVAGGYRLETYKVVKLSPLLRDTSRKPRRRTNKQEQPQSIFRDEIPLRERVA